MPLLLIPIDPRELNLNELRVGVQCTGLEASLELLDLRQLVCRDVSLAWSFVASTKGAISYSAQEGTIARVILDLL